MTSSPRTSPVRRVWESTPAVASPRHAARSHNLPSVCTTHVADRTDTTLKIGCVPNRSSCGTTRNCEVRTNKHGAFKWHRSSEGLIYDVHKNSSGAGMPYVHHAGSTRG